MRLFALAALVPCSVLFAQTQDIFITNGNVSFGVEFNATPIVFSALQDVMRADPAGDPAGMLFKTAWAYRLNADTREFIFNDGGAQATFLSSGPLGIATWPNVDNRNLISAMCTYIALPTSGNAGVVVARMQITNISALPVTLNLFHLVDIDLCGASYATNVSSPGANGHQTHVSSACTETADHFAAGADRWEAGSYTGTPAGNVDLYTRLEDAALYNLANTATNVGPFDIRSAFQWQDRVIRPGQSETYTITLGHNANGAAYGFNRYGSGKAGGLGVPQLSSLGDAVLGTTVTPQVSNCPPGSLVVLELGFTRAATLIADLYNWVGGGSNFVLFAAGGTASLPITIPNLPGFTGINLFGEGFVFDSTTTSVSGFPVTHTVGGQWVTGIY